MVAFFYLSFTFFFEHFLQGTMDLMYRMAFCFFLKTYVYLLFVTLSARNYRPQV